VKRSWTCYEISAGYFVEQLRLTGASGGSETDGEATSDEDAEDQVGDDFLLSTVIAFNEGVLANIDAVDTALIGVFTAVSAFTILAVDKINELAAVPRWLAVGLLAVSGLLSLSGYGFGFVLSRSRDVPRPLSFVTDFGNYGSLALARAIRETVRRSEQNLRVRAVKRLFVLGAVIVLIAGVVVVAYARLAGHVVVEWP